MSVSFRQGVGILGAQTFGAAAQITGTLTQGFAAGVPRAQAWVEIGAKQAAAGQRFAGGVNSTFGAISSFALQGVSALGQIVTKVLGGSAEQMARFAGAGQRG